jgi:hypothetical protein
MTKISDNDPDRAKGATESEEHHHDGNLALSEPLGHRDQDSRIKGADTDFPEPGGSPEHSGESSKPEVEKKTK